MEKQPAHPTHNEQEYTVAALAGVGLLLMMVAGAVAATTASESDSWTLVAIVGLCFVLGALGLWLMGMRPWEKFDDLKTPLYTGHDHDHHEEHHEALADQLVADINDDDVAVVTHVVEDVQVPHSEAAAQPTVVDSVEVRDAEPDLAAATGAETLVEISQVAEAGAEDVVLDLPEMEAEPVPDEAVSAPVLESPATPAAPAPAAPAATGKDNLKLIEGIGAKVEKALNASGITTFAQVAALSPAELERIVKEEHGVRIVASTESWGHQARAAMSNDPEALTRARAHVQKGYWTDPLTEIEGIGERVQEHLYEVGIRSYEQLAEAGDDVLDRLRQMPDVGGDFDFSAWRAAARERAANRRY